MDRFVGRFAFISVALSFLLQGALAQTCTTSACTTACLFFDASARTCKWDSTGKGYDGLTSCVCNWGGLRATVSALGLCTACQQDGLAGNSLAFYEYYAVVCNTYLEEGQGAANSLVAGTPTASVVEAFTETYLPVVQSGQCGGGGGGGGGGDDDSTSDAASSSLAGMGFKMAMASTIVYALLSFIIG